MAKISPETKERILAELRAFKGWLHSRMPFFSRERQGIIDKTDNLVIWGKWDELLDYLGDLPYYQEWVETDRPERYISPEEEETEERIKGIIPEPPKPLEPVVPEPLDPTIEGLLKDLKIDIIRDPTTGEILSYIYQGRSWTDPQEAITEVNKILEERIKLPKDQVYPTRIDTVTLTATDGSQHLYSVALGPNDEIISYNYIGPAGAQMSPQDQALATMGIFKNEVGQFVDEFGMVLGSSPEEARGRWQQKQEFERYLSERLTPFQQEQLALEKERMRQAAKPSLGEITQASIMEKQAWMSPFAAPVPWATRWSARAGGEFTPKAQAPQIQSPVQSWAR